MGNIQDLPPIDFFKDRITAKCPNLKKEANSTDAIDALLYALAATIDTSKVIQKIDKDSSIKYGIDFGKKHDNWDRVVFSMLRGCIQRIEQLQDENDIISNRLREVRENDASEISRLRRLANNAVEELNNQKASGMAKDEIIESLTNKIKVFDNINLTDLMQQNNYLLCEIEGLKKSISGYKSRLTILNGGKKSKSTKKRARR